MISLKKGVPVPRQATAQQGEAQSLTPAQRKKVLGDKPVGDLLNKVSDPNYVKNSRKVVGNGNTKMGKEAFMTLLLTQLQNQDPTSPLESHEMAAQLAQFTSLEKLEGIEKGIQGLNKKDDKGTNFDALKLIGKTVDANSSRLIRSDETDTHDVVFNLGGEADEVEIKIMNRLGEVVKTQQLFNQPKGKNVFNWNGLNDDALSVRKGDYTVSVSAKNTDGRKVFADTNFGGKITGVNFTAEGPVLMLGKSSIKLSDIKKIYETPTTTAQPVARPVQQGQQQPSALKRPGLAPPTAKEVMSSADGLAGIKMDGALKASLMKSGIKQ